MLLFSTTFSLQFSFDCNHQHKRTDFRVNETFLLNHKLCQIWKLFRQPSRSASGVSLSTHALLKRTGNRTATQTTRIQHTLIHTHTHNEKHE